jgi:hypothetical protein
MQSEPKYVLATTVVNAFERAVVSAGKQFDKFLVAWGLHRLLLAGNQPL